MIKSLVNIDYLLKEIDLPIRLQNILKANHFYSEKQFYQKVEQLIQEHTSNYLFHNQLVSFYPQFRERKASSNLLCNITGAVIKKGSYYFTYHRFIENLETGRVYTINKKICAELAYIDYFPQDLFTYEGWYYHLKNAYYENFDGIIDFYFLSRSCSEDCLDLYPLGNSKNKRKK